MMKQFHIIILCCFIINIGLFSKDLTIPALPVMAADLQMSAALAGTSITLFLIGTAISQLFFGIASDVLGRKPILLFGLSMCLIGNTFSIYSESSFWFLTWRLFTGIGCGAYPVITRAMANDLFHENKLTRALSYLSMVTVISPLLAPIIGGWITDHYHWRISFIITTFMSFLGLLTCHYLMIESNPDVGKRHFSWKSTVISGTHILSSEKFILYTWLSIIAFTPSVIYGVISPFIFQQSLGLTPHQNGFMYIYLAVGYFCGALLANKLAGIIDDDSLIYYGFMLSLISAALLLFGSYLIGTNGLLISFCMLIHSLGSGLVTPVTNKQAICLFRHSTGLSAALLGFFRILGVFTFASLYSITNIHSIIGFATVMLLLSGAGIRYSFKARRLSLIIVKT